MPFIQLPDFTMHYVVHGDGPETIVLIHGNIASTHWWEKFCALLPSGYRAVAMDLRGCGKSGRPVKGYEIRQFADDIYHLIRRIGLGKFHLMGHSMGGQIAMYFTLTHPEYVHTMTLLDSVPAAGLTLDDDSRKFFDVLRTNKAVLQQAVDACMQYSFDREFAIQACNDAWGCAPNIYHDNPETMHSTVLLDKVGTITAPTFIIHGREDLIIPYKMMDSTVKAMPAATLAIFDDCGHSPQVERPSKFSEVYFGLIKRHPIT